MSIILEYAAEWLETALQFIKTNWLWIVTPIAIWSMLWQLRNIGRGLNSRAWPTAPGIIEKSHVGSHYDSEHGTMYSASIAYRYTVKGKRYLGSTIQFGREGLSTSSKNGEIRFIEDYPEGRYVDVHYHPSRPKVSTLRTGVNGSGWIALILSVALSGVFLVLCLRELFLTLTVPLGSLSTIG